jgi:hypothetical protein
MLVIPFRIVFAPIERFTNRVVDVPPPLETSGKSDSRSRTPASKLSVISLVLTYHISNFNIAVTISSLFFKTLPQKKTGAKAGRV